MKTLGKLRLAALFLFLLSYPVHADVLLSKWLPLDADSKERIRHLIEADVANRTGFSTAEDDRLNTSKVKEEQQKEISAYKAAIDAANSEFQRAKKRSDDLTAQFQTASYDYEETRKNVDNIEAGIKNIDNQMARFEQDIGTQRETLSKWLKTTKQGEAIVAVIYTRGFMDSAHRLERLADEISAPLMARYMGTYIQSFTEVINNVLTGDFIKAVEEGTAKWNREEPFRISLGKEAKGTTYLRIKRYELYPFQAPETSSVKPGPDSKKTKATIIISKKDLETFLAENGFSTDKYDLSLVEGMIRDTVQANEQAQANQREQLISFRERINYLEQKMSGARIDKGTLDSVLEGKKTRLSKMKSDLEVLRLKKESAESNFQNAQAVLLEKKRVHESIIIKTSLVTVKRSETPAEAAADAVIEELKDVLNDARMQHYTSTTEVVNGMLTSESDSQAITEAKILAVRPLAFINEGDNIRVKVAFRVRTVLDAKEEKASTEKENEVKPMTVPALVPPPAPKPTIQPRKKKVIAKLPPVRRKSPSPTEKKSAPSTVETKAVQTVKALDFLFQLDKITRSGQDLTFLVKATNNADYIQFLVLYDEASSYSRSSISYTDKKKQQVKQVYLWQGDQKTASVDAYRGIPVEPGTSVTLELQFKAAKSNVSQLNLVPYVGIRSFIFTYSWQSKELAFKNLRVP